MYVFVLEKSWKKEKCKQMKLNIDKFKCKMMIQFIFFYFTTSRGLTEFLEIYIYSFILYFLNYFSFLRNKLN